MRAYGTGLAFLYTGRASGFSVRWAFIDIFPSPSVNTVSCALTTDSSVVFAPDSGRLSSRYSARAHVPHSAGLNDLVQLWLCCPATRALIHVTVLCVRHDTDVCIKPLLDTSAAYTPHFDWVVAHIGSCFPSTIIERVLSRAWDVRHSGSRQL
ncbi:integrator complex subunit 5-like [Pollicipes pollicipes]|uniref:integrator complex subunit 5-like n=1 Tax=Pollicipes pollicipes TaxID=41117 RepID=UPI001884DDD9|nr:integrator complex subunit 5-like [Pollicipes pollicipes]